MRGEEPRKTPKAPSLRELAAPEALTEGVPPAGSSPVRYTLANSLRHGFAVPPPSKREALGRGMWGPVP